MRYHLKVLPMITEEIFGDRAQEIRDNIMSNVNDDIWDNENIYRMYRQDPVYFERDPSQYLNYGLNWDRTSQGFKYWERIRLDWMRFLGKF